MTDESEKPAEDIAGEQDTESGAEKPSEEQNGEPDSPESLQAALEAAREAAESARDATLRAQAETENVRRRATRDVENAHRFALERFAADLLSVADSLEKAVESAGTAEDVAAVAEGGSHGATAHGIQVTLAGGVLHAGAIPSDDDPIRPRQLELEHGPGAGRYERCSRLQSASNRFPAGLPPGCTLETGTAVNSGAPTAGQDTNRRRPRASSLTAGGSASNQLPVR